MGLRPFIQNFPLYEKPGKKTLSKRNSVKSRTVEFQSHAKIFPNFQNLKPVDTQNPTFLDLNFGIFLRDRGAPKSL